MFYRNIQDDRVSLLGFGAMRLPVFPDGQIDEAQAEQMIDYCIEHGVNYFDTAYPYHGGRSELVVGKALAKYPRDSYYLADKYPGHQIAKSYNPAEVFEDQLKKCQVEYFDFYLLHNISENSIGTYMDPQWGILEYFKEQKRLGRIKHLGFSTHGAPELIAKWLDFADGAMEFCQIQMNYLDWTLQNAKAKYELCAERNIPVIVMESVRGGKLAVLPEDQHARLAALRPEDSDASWGYRWLQQFDNVAVVLAGVSNMEQTIDNVKSFTEDKPIGEAENTLLYDIADQIADCIPCTACRYCCAGCPMQLDIPMLISKINDHKVASSVNISMFIEALPEDKIPAACISCGKCVKACPQNINIPEEFKKFTEALSKEVSWAELCRQREAAAEALRNKK